MALKSFLAREKHWEAGIAIAPNWGPKRQLYSIAYEHTFFIGNIWDDPRWLLKVIGAFNLLISDDDSIDRGGVAAGGAFGYRWSLPGNKGNIDTYVGGYYSNFSNKIKGYGIEASVQWSYALSHDD